MTPQSTVVPRIPVGVTMLLVFVGFGLVLMGITSLQAIGGIALMSALAIAFFGPGKRIEAQESDERATDSSRSNN